MRVPSAAQLLAIWEGVLNESPTRRALSLLAAIYPERSEAELSALPIGRRDARLLQLRECLFGSQLLLVVSCPQCGQRIESRVPAAELSGDLYPPEPPGFVAESNGYRVRFRLPASDDLMALPNGINTYDARKLLLGRCILDARNMQGEETPLSVLPDVALADLTAQMASADPCSDVELAFDCPDCGHHWQEVFDINGFFWREIHAWAKRTLRDVHALARAYGWTEADTLSLSPTRRQIYLELCRQ